MSGPTLRTRLTKLLDIKTPIVSAPMALQVQGALQPVALAVHRAGGFGFVALGYEGAVKLRATLRSLREQLNVPADQPLPIGAGFIGWVADQAQEDVLATILEEHPRAVWLSFGTDLGNYVRRIREHNQKHGRNVLVFLQATSLEEALQAVNDFKVDVLVVQGMEAGGHHSASAPSLYVFLTAVLAAFPVPENRPVILAAGGIHTGAQLASVLTLGAAGAVIGTRLLFTAEIDYPPAKTEALLKAGLGSTISSTAFDEVRGTLGWPGDIRGRAIRNDIITDQAEGLSLEERRRRFTAGEGNRSVVMAGMGVGLTSELKSVQAVLEEYHEGAVQALRVFAQMLS